MQTLISGIIILGFVSLILIVTSMVGVAREDSWSLGKRWLWGILSLVLGLLGSGIAFWMRGRKTLAIVCFSLLVVSLIINILTRGVGALQKL